jgi:hypothetical protein
VPASLVRSQHRGRVSAQVNDLVGAARTRCVPPYVPQWRSLKRSPPCHYGVSLRCQTHRTRYRTKRVSTPPQGPAAAPRAFPRGPMGAAAKSAQFGSPDLRRTGHFPAATPLSRQPSASRTRSAGGHVPARSSNWRCGRSRPIKSKRQPRPQSPRTKPSPAPGPYKRSRSKPGSQPSRQPTRGTTVPDKKGRRRNIMIQPKPAPGPYKRSKSTPGAQPARKKGGK